MAEKPKKLNLKGLPKNAAYKITKRSHRSHLKPSDFDATRYLPYARIGGHTATPDDAVDDKAFGATTFKSMKPDPKRYTKKGTGMGGTLRPREEVAAGGGAAATGSTKRKGPQRARAPRRNPANTEFRRHFERGDLPLRVEHMPSGVVPQWTIEPDKLDYAYYLPIFVSGLRELEDPYQSLAVVGCRELLAANADKVLVVVPQLIVPIRQALETRVPPVVCRAIIFLQQLVEAHPDIGEALVPYYRQLLPVLALYKGRQKNTGDKMDYSQHKRQSIPELVDETLALLQRTGGPDAFINLKYMIPTMDPQGAV